MTWGSGVVKRKIITIILAVVGGPLILYLTFYLILFILFYEFDGIYINDFEGHWGYNTREK